jgi:aminopeptidase N
MLTEHPAFDWKNPNKIRSVIGVFAGQNLASFHAADGGGYRFLAEQVLRLDASNPQIAARLVTPLTRWEKFAPEYGSQMKAALEWINAGGDQSHDLSKDLYEVVHKSLQD